MWASRRPDRVRVWLSRWLRYRLLCRSDAQLDCESQASRPLVNGNRGLERRRRPRAETTLPKPNNSFSLAFRR